MQNRQAIERPRLSHTVILVVGVLGAIAAFDATLLFLLLLLGAGPAPYGGLLLGAALFFVVVGGVLAWTAYLVLRSEPPEGGHSRRRKVRA